MMIVVARRVFESHGDVTQAEVEFAVLNGRSRLREAASRPDTYIGIGPGNNRDLQWIANRLPGVDSWYVFHAMKASEKLRRELEAK